MKKQFIYDVNTTNISFIQTAVDLKKLGIKNNMFFLKLFDPSLKGVDPFSPFLTNDQVFRIINECIINPWYFLRECVRIPDQGNPAGVPFLLNRANLAQAWCFLHSIDHYETIPRQIGKTQSALSIIDWEFLFGTTDSEFMFLNLSQERAQENLSRLKEQRDLLPQYLQFKVAYDEEGNEIKKIDNVKSLKNINNNNKIITKPAARSKEAAERIGRGNTQTVQMYDEFEFISYIGTITAASGPAFVTAAENAKKNGAHAVRCFLSTPGDLDSQPGQDALKILEQTCKWTESFYDMDIEDIREYIKVNSGNGIVYIEYSYKQLGKDEAWFNEMCKVLNNDKMKIKREILLQRIHGSSDSPYEPEDLDAIQELKGKIVEEILINKLFKLDVYEKLIKDRIYFVGVDVAGGYGADNSAITIWDPYTRKTVAEFRSANIGVKDLIKLIYVLVKKYVPRAILFIERNYNGEAVLDHLRDTDIRGNLYFDNSKDVMASLDEKVSSGGFLEVEAAKRRFYGIYTHGKSRELMFEILGTYVKEHKESFVGAYIIDDLMKLVRTRTSKIEAGPGFHDDNIMSFNMCLYGYYYGNNLSRYGFVKGYIPNEENQNKGMDYGEIYNALSDSEREALGLQEDSYISYQDLDMGKMISDKHQLVSEEELKKSLHSDGTKKEIKAPNLNQKLDPYQMKLFREMEQAQRDSEAFNNRIGFNSGYRTMSEEYETGIDFDSNLFTELNN